MKNVNEHRYTRAKERVESLKSFYHSLIAYCVVIPLLIYINYRTTDIPWAIFSRRWMGTWFGQPLDDRLWIQSHFRKGLGRA